MSMSDRDPQEPKMDSQKLDRLCELAQEHEAREAQMRQLAADLGLDFDEFMRAEA